MIECHIGRLRRASVPPLGHDRIGFSAAADVDGDESGLTGNMALETGGVLVAKNAASS